MSDNKPKGFNDLPPAELYRSALEDFALPVEEGDKGKKKVLIAAFVEGGVDWADYVEQHPEFAPSEAEATEAELRTRLREGAVVTSGPSKGLTVESVEAVEPEEKWDEPREGHEVPETARVVVKETIPVTSRDSYLIKMTRENPLFEVRGHKFTKDNPYALVNAVDADYILENEDGFRQATPSELREFYG